MKTKAKRLKDFLSRRKNLEIQYGYLTEVSYIRSNDSHYESLDELLHKANNLWNMATYQMRQYFFRTGKFLSYGDLDTIFKQMGKTLQHPIYYDMKNVQNAQQILKMVAGNFIYYSKALKAWKKNPKNFTGKPKLPGYSKPGSRHMMKFSNQTAKLTKDGIRVSCLDWNFKIHQETDKIQEVRLIPHYHAIKIEVIYKTNRVVKYKEDNNRYLSIDPGVDNAFTCTSNVPGVDPFVINGKPVKSLNQFFNKRRGQLLSTLEKEDHKKTSSRLVSLSKHRALKLDKFAHEASKCIIDFALSHELNTIVIGKNAGWKNGSKLSKKTNQNFIGIPHAKMIEKIIYKANLAGIVVVTTTEGYTSQTSFLDNEMPVWNNGEKGRKARGLSPVKRRKFRGLFVSNNGTKINADVNGAYQILKKVVPNAYVNGIEGVGLHPSIVNMDF